MSGFSLFENMALEAASVVTQEDLTRLDNELRLSMLQSNKASLKVEHYAGLLENLATDLGELCIARESFKRLGNKVPNVTIENTRLRLQRISDKYRLNTDDSCKVMAIEHFKPNSYSFQKAPTIAAESIGTHIDNFIKYITGIFKKLFGWVKSLFKSTDDTVEKMSKVESAQAAKYEQADKAIKEAGITVSSSGLVKAPPELNVKEIEEALSSYKFNDKTCLIEMGLAGTLTSSNLSECNTNVMKQLRAIMGYVSGTLKLVNKTLNEKQASASVEDVAGLGETFEMSYVPYNDNLTYIGYNRFVPTKNRDTGFIKIDGKKVSVNNKLVVNFMTPVEIRSFKDASDSSISSAQKKMNQILDELEQFSNPDFYKNFTSGSTDEEAAKKFSEFVANFSTSINSFSKAFTSVVFTFARGKMNFVRIHAEQTAKLAKELEDFEKFMKSDDDLKI